MVKLEENQDTELIEGFDQDGNIVLVMKIKNVKEDCNVVTFQFKNKHTFQECLELFGQCRILSINDILRNRELQIGCADDGMEECIFMEIVDYDKDNIYQPSAYGFTVLKEDAEYEAVKKIFDLIEREKEEQKSDEHRFDKAKYAR